MRERVANSVPDKYLIFSVCYERNGNYEKKYNPLKSM
jgi:hypothetical protein